jgi:hypothetical protein
MLSARPWNSSLPDLMKPTSASSAPPKAFANARSVAVAASLLSSTVVLQEPGGAIGPRLARAERAVIRVFHRAGVGRLVDRAGLKQLVQPRDLGRVLRGCRLRPVHDRAALVHEPLPGLECLLLVVQCAGERLELASLLRRGLRREPAQRLGDEPLALGLGQRLAFSFEAHDNAPVGRPDLLRGLDLLTPQLRELRIPHRRRLHDQLVDRFCVAAVPGPQGFDLGDPALVLGYDAIAALVHDVEERALELARDPLQVLGAILHTRGVVGSGR